MFSTRTGITNEVAETNVTINNMCVDLNLRSKLASANLFPF